ncbi:MAG: hypothetical protein GW815_00045 [Candidatus Moranbacteria bacterium]|nr:hypothetical protein [Candidatus Moranbacteria bacterium]OIQ03106.1 MAG: hypothetical protein AUK58_02265 [Candidatus Moranbacteria bacterium CG2_30_41_165]PIP25482.1 MAG: hypothetical protein COX32_03250 [Candidatus Moranbacteria bacterium CG23_combo_of_CG06-09_8_20_14_all_41_28]PIV86041.1 MAG: hypothetical protein COW50_03610 [Candidatus Moranbacteria bacterium CG17_big_fil_post_rev_8_21_14_2_50_41_107]PIW94149.1 MAG: hypothetical protein COZ86_02535 [Candidatus Moranbacteria bacterium CG_
MIIRFLQFFDPLVGICFELNDILISLLSKHIFLWKKLLLVGAFGSLFFIFFPEMRKDFGSMAETMLLGILFLSPLSRIFRMKILFLLMSMRREFGILMGCFALVHSLAYFIDPSSFLLYIKPYLNTSFFSMQPIFFFGMMAFLFTLPLLLTSNTLSVRLLGPKRWKFLHRSVYILLLLMLLHIFFLKGFLHGFDIFELLQSLSIVVSYIFLWILAKHNPVPFLQELITYMNHRYDSYHTEMK